MGLGYLASMALAIAGLGALRARALAGRHTGLVGGALIALSPVPLGLTLGWELAVPAWLSLLSPCGLAVALWPALVATAGRAGSGRRHAG